MTGTAFQLLAKSLKVSKFRLALIATISSIISIDATFMISLLNELGRLIVTSLVFTFASLLTLFILLDTLSRSNQSIAMFQALGARRYPVTSIILVGLVGVSLIGAAFGVIFGLLLASVYASLSSLSSTTLGGLDTFQLLLSTIRILAACATGVATGVVIGVRVSWGKLN